MSDAQMLRLPRAREFPVEDDAGDEDSSEDIGQKTDHQCDGEAFDRTRSEEEQEEARHDGGDVSIDDGPPGFTKARVNRRRNRFARAKLFTNALEDQHVGIDRHTDGEDDAGDAGQRERSAELRERGNQQNGIQKQRQNRINASLLVIHQHDQDHGNQPGHTGEETFADGIGAE
jgi:hypothetical protein